MASKSSIIITIDQQRYYLQPTRVTLSAQSRGQVSNFKSDFIPTTAIRWENVEFDDIVLAHICKEYAVDDDVWTSSFLTLVILLQSGKPKPEPKSRRILRINNAECHLPRGPLVIEKSTGHVFKVCKLVKDTHFAFLSAVVPGTKPKGAFHEFPDSGTIEVALPSRLYFEKTDTQPLAGVRLAIKDTIALKGLRTGYGSKAWAETYGAEQQTAPCVQLLLDAGAIVVGKVKSSEFAEGVDPADWTEGVCPYNPRGDGQQKPSSSSTGSASAIAAYDWLDVSYGTDTGGSIRHPAGVQGIFGQRPTHDKIDLTGVLGATPLFNTVGIFARETKMFTTVGSYLVEPTMNVKVHPERRKYNLLYPTRAPEEDNRDPFHGNQLRWFPHEEVDPMSYREAEKQLEAVVSRMETELDCKRVPFNLDSLWRATHPIGQSRSIDEATGFIYGVITTASACQSGVDQFIRDYMTANDGQQPPISKLVQDRFQYGRECTNERIAEALEATQAFGRWVLNDLFGSLDQDATTLLIFPQSWGRTDYRDAKPEQPNLFKEYFSIYSFAYLCGLPDYTIPIGEVPYQSPITKKQEYLPVSLSLLGRPGTDLELFGVVDYLHDKGVISDVRAGSRMYSDRA